MIMVMKTELPNKLMLQFNNSLCKSHYITFVVHDLLLIQIYTILDYRIYVLIGTCESGSALFLASNLMCDCLVTIATQDRKYLHYCFFLCIIQLNKEMETSKWFCTLKAPNTYIVKYYMYFSTYKEQKKNMLLLLLLNFFRGFFLIYNNIL